MLQWTWGYRYLFELVFWISSDKYPEVELLGHVVVLFLIFWGAFLLFSIACTNLHSHQECTRVPLSSRPCQHLISCVFDNSHCNRREWHFTVVLIYVSLVISGFEHLFLCLLASCVLFGKIQILCPLFIQNIWVFLKLNEFLMYFEY